MGAPASLTLWHPDPGVSRRTITRVRIEADRLEGIFSLYRTDSEIVRLNRDGRRTSPSRELVDVLDQARRIADVCGGAFDPTVQPLWLALARWSASTGPQPPDTTADLKATRALIDYTAMDAGPRGVVLGKPGMAITLNGIAQGYLTDRITDLLRIEGFEHAMVELGETRALGAAPDGRPFEIALVNPLRPAIADRSVDLADEAISVSGGYGMEFDLPGMHHLLDPATGQSANRLLDVAVLAPRAVWADALSTAIFVAGEAAARRILGSYPNARALMTRNDGSSVTLDGAA
jgi:thiamine biosynthesis lipoprotein